MAGTSQCGRPASPSGKGRFSAWWASPGRESPPFFAPSCAFCQSPAGSFSGRSSSKRAASSGGMLRGVLIAVGFSCGPSLLVADEPTTSLDVTTQAQILRLLDGLRSETGVATCFITHDLGVVAHL